jgi:hypothetical protein
MQHTGDLCRVAQTMDDFGRELQLLRDLVPYRHEPRRTRVMKAEPSAHPVIHEGGELAPDL